MIFVDTSYFLRFLLEDIPGQHKEAKNLFLQASEGKIKIFTSLVVIFEIYWVMTSFYGKKKKEVSKVLENVLNLTFIKLEGRKLLSGALDIYKNTNLDFEDSYNLAYAKDKNAKDFKTFDKKLRKVFLE